MKKAPKGSILFMPNQTSVTFTNEESVLEVALREQVEIAHSCGGMGTCGTCRIEIESDIASLPERNEIEQEMANDRGFKNEIRLACQLSPQPGLVARICLELATPDEEV